jgi:serine protease
VVAATVGLLPDAQAKPPGDGGGKPSKTTTTLSPTSGDLESEQWALGNIEASGAWSVATGQGVIVAVVDSGVDKDHPEFAGKLVKGASWIGCGRRAVTPCTDPSQWDDENGHGTHVAGIVAAPRNGVGTTGVAPGAQIMPVRVLDADGSGTSDDVAAGIRYAADNGAKVINLSLGGLPVQSQLYDETGIDSAFSEAIAYATERGVLVVVAAGNEGAPLCDDEPLDRDGALCVGATDSNDLKSYYSNFGYGLDIVAPGGLGSVLCDDPEDILSTYAISADTLCTDTIGYETLAGTSMAAPHVSGIGALLAQRGIEGSAAAARIIATADDLGIPGSDPVYGAGRVNARRAVTAGS